MICTFFGHHMVAQKIEPALRSTLIDLIEIHDVRLFYVGNHGAFDAMVYRVLRELAVKYSIEIRVVRAYLPEKKNEHNADDYADTVLPEGIETVPKRFAIAYRNKWMLERADFVITYVVSDIGSGAAQFKRLAAKKGKQIIELSK